MRKMINQGALNLNTDEIQVIQISELDLHNVRSETIVSNFSTFKNEVNSKTIICTFSTWACFWVVLLKDDLPCDLKYYEDLSPLDYDAYTVRSVNAVLEHYIKSNHPELADFVDIVNTYFELDVRLERYSEKFMKSI